MLFAKIAGIFILVWFYKSAKDVGESAIQWAIIGVLGYWIVWWLTTILIANPMLDVFHDIAILRTFLEISPALLAIAGAFLIRIKLLRGVEKAG